MRSRFCLFLSVAILTAILTLFLPACDAGDLPLRHAEDHAHYRTDISASALMDTVLAAIPSEVGYAEVGDGYINASMWGEDYAPLLDAVSEYAIRLSEQSDMNIDELGILRVKDDTSAAWVAAAAETYLSAQALRYRDLLSSYNPAELPKASGGRVLVCGRYVLYTLLDEQATRSAQKTFQAALTVPEG